MIMIMWDGDEDGGEEHHIDTLRSPEIPSEAIVVDAARNCVTSLRRSKAQKAFSLSLWLSDAQTTGFTLSSGKITQMLSTKYFQPHERIFLWLHVLPKINVIATTFNPRRRSKRRKRFLPFPGICLAGRKSCHCCPENVKVWYFMWLKVITRVQEIISTISNIFEERHSEAKIWILCVDLQIFSAESLPRPPLTCSDHRPARMYNENLLKPYI